MCIIFFSKILHSRWEREKRRDFGRVASRASAKARRLIIVFWWFFFAGKFNTEILSVEASVRPGAADSDGEFELNNAWIEHVSLQYLV